MLTAFAFFGLGVALLLLIQSPWPWNFVACFFVIAIVDWGRGWIAKSRNKKGLCAICIKEIPAYPQNRVQMTGRMGGVYANVCTNCLNKEGVITRSMLVILLVLIAMTIGFVYWAKSNGN